MIILLAFYFFVFIAAAETDSESSLSLGDLIRDLDDPVPHTVFSPSLMERELSLDSLMNDLDSMPTSSSAPSLLPLLDDVA